MEILYMDTHFVAVNKPAGLMMHRSRLVHRNTRFALQMVRDQVGCHVYPVHRLDKPTSGVLIFGLYPGAAGHLAQCFSERRVSKFYLAVVRGWAPASGIIDKPLARYRDKKKRTNIIQPAFTRFLRLGTIELPYAVSRYPTSRYSLVLARPETGRLHQIRRHLHHISHPVIGDQPHGDGRHNRFFAKTFNCSRLLLAAVRVVFDHPFTGAAITIDAPIDACFCHVLNSFGWRATAVKHMAPPFCPLLS
ncbi:MAG: pseudouridylate synthase [Desulfobacteraceae bacterium]|nr:pseudouridylate synthase [Desulfobacteraceae bacterium]